MLQSSSPFTMISSWPVAKYWDNSEAQTLPAFGWDTESVIGLSRKILWTFSAIWFMVVVDWRTSREAKCWTEIAGMSILYKVDHVDHRHCLGWIQGFTTLSDDHAWRNGSANTRHSGTLWRTCTFGIPRTTGGQACVVSRLFSLPLGKKQRKPAATLNGRWTHTLSACCSFGSWSRIWRARNKSYPLTQSGLVAFIRYPTSVETPTTPKDGPYRVLLEMMKRTSLFRVTNLWYRPNFNGRICDSDMGLNLDEPEHVKQRRRESSAEAWVDTLVGQDAETTVEKAHVRRSDPDLTRHQVAHVLEAFSESFSLSA